MIYDAIVLGAGPVGLYMCKLLEENNKSYLLMENFHNVGGQCQNIYPNKCMYDIPGLGAITGGEFVEFLLSYINKKNIRLGETCISHNKQEDIFQIVTNIAIYKCKNFILAKGMGECVFNKPNIEGLEHLENKQIFYFPTNSHTYENKNILIFGGGDSALDAVECLYKKNNVSLIHRRNTFKAMASKTNFLNFIKLYSPFNIKSLNTTEKILTSLTIENEEKQVTLECDYIFFCYGYNSGLMPEKIPVTIDNMQSHEKGLFAVGGISTYEQKRELITSGMWECRIVLENLLI